MAKTKPIAVLATRGLETATRLLCGNTGKREFIEASSKEFENGNTFVKLAKELTGRDVEVWIPPHFTPDLLMETLIKIRIAHANGAKRVTVILPHELEKITVTTGDKWSAPLPLGHLFRIAGANSLRYQGRWKAFPNYRAHPAFTVEDLPAIVTGHYHPTFRDRLASALKLGVKEISEIAATGTRVVLVAPAVPPVNQSLFQTLSEIAYLKSLGSSVILVTPYLPYARSDKKDQPGVAITGRLVADLIEMVGPEMIVFARAHAPQSEGFFSIPTLHVPGRKAVQEFLRKEGVQAVISPDAGFQKDATLYANALGVPVGVINKQRCLTTGEASIVEGSNLDVTGLTVATTDDETATGGTLDSSAKDQTKRGASRNIGVVTHLTGNAKKALESSDLSLLVVTDTLPITIPPSDKLKVISIVDEFAELMAPIFDLSESECGELLAGPTTETSA